MTPEDACQMATAQAARFTKSLPRSARREDYHSAAQLGVARAFATYDSTAGAQLVTWVWKCVQSELMHQRRVHMREVGWVQTNDGMRRDISIVPWPKDPVTSESLDAVDSSIDLDRLVWHQQMRTLAYAEARTAEDQAILDDYFREVPAPDTAARLGITTARVHHRRVKLQRRLGRTLVQGRFRRRRA